MINTYLKNLIKEKEAISIYEFMNIALYHNKYGYYMKKVPLGNDFITAPEVSQLFSEVISIWLMMSWKKIKGDFILVELGPGRGTLINDILRVTQKFTEFYNSMSVHLVEISPTLRHIQKQNLKNFQVHWHDSIHTLPEKPTLLIANEFFDSLPIKQFIYNQNKWYENKITVENEVFKVIKQKVKEQKEELHDNAVIEVCPAGMEIIKEMEKRIKKNKGSALVIDYGYLNLPYKSTIQSIKEHNYNDFLKNIGDADITAHVNFKALQDCLQNTEVMIMTQREFLYSFGIRERMHMLIQNATNEQKDQILKGFLRITENMGTLFKVMII
ncbi:MAG: ATP synthase subunit beta [Candidatus Mesenet longicola]|uniref:ATP synthase subunit beta n=1 Tax=Candidatus Mesenet longicola TaxID=1892558 RepID=A0A8J3HX86_9RICK|nr:MAG: ATP synthase subunit beta [Candidatus Mesenet longicola]GHM59951.1 MAG: ATP synthase subunit beta [Candidatus Mesenet longicola]